MIIVDVVLPFPIREYFSYILPHSMIPIIGGRVVVPFRLKNVIGIIISFHEEKKINILDLRSVKYTIDNHPIFNTSLLNILIWLSKYYHHPIGSIFFTILPNILKSKNIECNKFYFKKNIYHINQFKINKKFFLSKKISLKINKILITNNFTCWLISEINLYIKIKFYLGLFKEILKKNLQILIIVPFIKDIYKIFFF